MSYESKFSLLVWGFVILYIDMYASSSKPKDYA